MNNVFTEPDFSFIKSVLIEAGNLAFQNQKKNILITRKNDRSIVTATDLAVQKLIISRFQERYRDFNYIHEEEFDRSVNRIESDRISVIIDPIDGTAMYSMFLPFWCVSIGIFSGYTPLYGFIYSPPASMLIYNDNDNSYVNDAVVHVDKTMPIDSETNILFSTEVYDRIRINFPGKVRNLGSTAMQSSLIIDNRRNRVLAFIGKSYLWDWAGSIPVILKAGGNLKYLSGKELDIQEIAGNRYELRDYLIAYSADDFGDIRKIFSPR